MIDSDRVDYVILNLMNKYESFLPKRFLGFFLILATFSSRRYHWIEIFYLNISMSH